VPRQVWPAACTMLSHSRGFVSCQGRKVITVSFVIHISQQREHHTYATMIQRQARISLSDSASLRPVRAASV